MSPSRSLDPTENPKSVRPELPDVPETGTGLICECGEAWWQAFVAMRDDYTSHIIIEATCVSCGAPAPPPVERNWRAPKVT